MKKYIFVFLIALILSGCTQNEMARKYGGSMEIQLPPGTKLINATWKEEEIWYLYTERGSEKPKNTVFKEKSKFGVIEGHVVFVEK